MKRKMRAVMTKEEKELEREKGNPKERSRGQNEVTHAGFFFVLAASLGTSFSLPLSLTSSFPSFLPSPFLPLSLLYFLFPAGSALSPRAMAELQAQVEKEKSLLRAGENMAKEERDKAEFELKKKEEELKKAQSVCSLI